MKITFENEHGTYTIDETGGDTWGYAIGMFVSVLRSAGYIINLNTEEIIDTLHEMHTEK